MKTKPTRGTPINYSSPLAKDLEFVIQPDWDYEPITKQILTRSGTQTITGSSFGGGLSTTAGAQRVSMPWPKRKYDARTYLILADFGTWGLYGAPVYTGTYESFTYQSTAPRYVWWIHGPSYNTGNAAISATSAWSASLANRKNAAVALCWDRLGDGVGKGYLNGKLIATSNVSVTTVSDRTHSTGGAVVYVGAASGVSMGNLTSSGVFHWYRALSVAEIADISANPWQIFNTKKVFYMYNPPVANKTYSQIINGWW